MKKWTGLLYFFSSFKPNQCFWEVSFLEIKTAWTIFGKKFFRSCGSELRRFMPCAKRKNHKEEKENLWHFFVNLCTTLTLNPSHPVNKHNMNHEQLNGGQRSSLLQVGVPDFTLCLSAAIIPLCAAYASRTPLGIRQPLEGLWEE